MVIEEWQKRYIEAGLFNYSRLKESNLLGDKLIVESIDRARNFFANQKQGGDLQVAFIKDFYEAYSGVKDSRKKGIHHYKVCQSLGIEQAAGYVVRQDIVLRVALHAATLGLMKFE